MFLMCAFAMVAFGWMLLLPGLFTSVIQNRTGFPARVDYFYANPFTGEVRMRGLAIINPSGFADTNLVDLRQFTAKADLFSLLGGNPVVEMSTVDVARITVVTNAQGTNNLDLLYRRLSPVADSKKTSSKASAAAPAAAPLNFLIHNLDLRVDEVLVKDERPGKVPLQVHQLAFQRTYKNVTPSTQFNNDLPPAVAAAGKNISEVVSSGGLKQIVARTTQPVDRKTYAWGDKRENAEGNAGKLEEQPKP
ncbi:MAG TPA: hypothetical protein VIM46_03820 [Luteolibacter sp.]